MPASLWISFWYFLLGSSRLTRGFVARKSFSFIGNLQTNEAQFCGALLFRTSNSPITIFVLHHLTEFWANSRFLEQWFYLQFSFGMCAKISVNLLFKPNPSFPELQYEPPLSVHPFLQIQQNLKELPFPLQSCKLFWFIHQFFLIVIPHLWHSRLAAW